MSAAGPLHKLWNDNVRVKLTVLSSLRSMYQPQNENWKISREEKVDMTAAIYLPVHYHTISNIRIYIGKEIYKNRDNHFVKNYFHFYFPELSTLNAP